MASVYWNFAEAEMMSCVFWDNAGLEVCARNLTRHRWSRSAGLNINVKKAAYLCFGVIVKLLWFHSSCSKLLGFVCVSFTECELCPSSDNTVTQHLTTFNISFVDFVSKTSLGLKSGHRKEQPEPKSETLSTIRPIKSKKCSRLDRKHRTEAMKPWSKPDRHESEAQVLTSCFCKLTRCLGGCGGASLQQMMSFF